MTNNCTACYGRAGIVLRLTAWDKWSNIFCTVYTTPLTNIVMCTPVCNRILKSVANQKQHTSILLKLQFNAGTGDLWPASRYQMAHRPSEFAKNHVRLYTRPSHFCSPCPSKKTVLTGIAPMEKGCPSML